MNKMICPS